MTKMSAIPIYGKKKFKNYLLLQNCWTDFNETWHVALGTRVLQCVYKLLPLDGLDLFNGQINIGRPCI